MKKVFNVLGKILIFLFATLLTAFLASVVIISLPLTEKIYNKANYDLTLKEPYWEKEYLLELEIKPKDIPYTDKKIEETRNIIYKRLKKYGVNDVDFQRINTEDKTTEQLKVRVRSDKDIETVDTLVIQRYYVRFVVAKEGVDFNNEEDPYAVYNIENYEATSYTRHDFRTVYLTKLNSTSGEKSYFAIYKPWENKLGQFYKDMDKLAGKSGGVAIDGFVSPAVFPVVSQQTSNGGVSRQPFALGMSFDDTQKELVDNLFNSGVIPLSYTSISQEDVNLILPEFNYIYAALVIVALVVFGFIIKSMISKEKIDLVSLASYGLTVSSGITALKIFAVPVSLLNLFIAGMFFTLIFLVYNFSDKFKGLPTIVSIITLSSLFFVGFGYVQLIALMILVLVTVNYVIKMFLSWYLNFVNRIIS